MSLDNVLQQLEAVRSKLKASVQNKGVTLADDPTLYAIDDGVNQIVVGDDSGGGGSTESCKFYKCASADTDNKTWTGYELILTDGIYSVSETVTEGLTYSGFTPVVDSVYNEDATLFVKDFYTGILLVSPTNMTSNETDEWVISASSTYMNEDTYAPYNAFSGSDTETYGWVSGGYSPHSKYPNSIQWQNKVRKSKILNYSLQVNNWSNLSNRERFPGSWVLEGSNDGSGWVIVDDRTNEITDYTQLESLKYYEFTCQNPGYYSYYRIYVKAGAKPSEDTFTYIGQIKAFGQFE